MGLKLDIKVLDEYGDFFVKEIIKTMSRKYGRYTYRIKCKCCPYEKFVESHALKKLKSCQFCSIYKRIGTRNGSLVFEEYLGKSLYKAKCDCGNYCSIRSNSTSHCGCKTQEKRPASYKNTKNILKPEDHIGKIYGNLKIIKYLGIIENGRIYEAKCRCGNKTIIKAASIGYTQSCGCIQKSSVSRGSKVWNSKLTEQKVMSLRHFYLLKIYSKKELMEMFDVNPSCFEKIIQNKIWKHAIPPDFIPKIAKKIKNKSIDFVGKKINSWDILGITSDAKIHVKCKCGKDFIRCAFPIINGKSKSCHACSQNKKDYSFLIGKEFGNQKVLTVYRKNERPFGMVRCNCGHEREIGIWHLINNESFKCLKCCNSKIVA